MKKLLRQAQLDAGLTVLTFQEMRKTCLKAWEVNKVKPWNVSAWAGHEDGQARVTRDHYTGTPEIDWEDVPKMEAHLRALRKSRLVLVR